MSHRMNLAAVSLAAALLLGPAVALAQQPQIESRFAEANGVRLHYLVTGQSLGGERPKGDRTSMIGHDAEPDPSSRELTL